MHDIWSKRYYGDRALPAWHGINYLNEVGLEFGQRTAQEVIALMGNPEVRSFPLVYNINGAAKESGMKALVRFEPSNPLDTGLQIGVVSEDYVEVGVQAAAELWDKYVAKPVETLAFLREGAKLFITAKLPAFDIQGETVDNYLILNNPMDGGESAQGIVSNVRVVCQNTLHAAIAQASNSFRIRHTTGAHARLGKWMGRMVEQAEIACDLMRESYAILASKPTNRVQVEMLTSTLYPMPHKPIADTPRKMAFTDVMDAWKQRCEWVGAARTEVVKLWDGAAVGFERSQTEGTLWHWYNAVAELETWRRGTRDSMTYNLIAGDRAFKIRKAHAMAVTAAQDKEVVIVR